MKLLLSFLSALLIGLAAAGTSLADPACPMPGPGGAPGPMMMGQGHQCPDGDSHDGCALGKLIASAAQNAAQLGLAADKISELDKLKEECLKTKILDGAQVKVACMELHKLMTPQNFNIEAVKSRIKNKMDLVAAMKVKEAELYQKALSFFTPDQLKKLGGLSPAICDPATGVHPMEGHAGHQHPAQADKGPAGHTCPTTK
ncbi:MAG: hypothetical protein HZA01_03145 [Nitrospinae bacterium]|nr:hypothetical protein [Nitrospinota bacterium]